MITVSILLHSIQHELSKRESFDSSVFDQLLIVNSVYHLVVFVWVWFHFSSVSLSFLHFVVLSSRSLWECNSCKVAIWKVHWLNIEESVNPQLFSFGGQTLSISIRPPGRRGEIFSQLIQLSTVIITMTVCPLAPFPSPSHHSFQSVSFHGWSCETKPSFYPPPLSPVYSHGNSHTLDIRSIILPLLLIHLYDSSPSIQYTLPSDDIIKPLLPSTLFPFLMQAFSRNWTSSLFVSPFPSSVVVSLLFFYSLTFSSHLTCLIFTHSFLLFTLRRLPFSRHLSTYSSSSIHYLFLSYKDVNLILFHCQTSFSSISFTV